MFLRSIFCLTATLSITACSDCSSETENFGLCKKSSNAPSLKHNSSRSSVSSVSFDKSIGITLNGTQLDNISSAALKNGTTEIGLQKVSQSSSKLNLHFPASFTLAAGVWSLILNEANAQSSITVYLDAADGSITDAKIASVSASKIIGVLPSTSLPDLSTSYAPLNAGKVNVSVIPDLSSHYASLNAGKIGSAAIPDLSFNYAPLISGKIAATVLPDLSGNYAQLVSGKVSSSVIPDLSGTYSLASHTHSADDIGAVDVSEGPLDAGKVIKLNSAGKIDSSMARRGSKPWFRISRAKLNSTTTDAQKDSLCQSEFGPEYNASTNTDPSFYIASNIGSCWLVYGSNIPRGPKTTAIAGGFYDLSVTNPCGAGSYPVACISNEAPYRTSRTVIPSTSSDSVKDTTCSNDLGGNYSAANVDDIPFINTKSSFFTSLVVANSSNLMMLSRDTTSGFLTASTNGSSSSNVLCVRSN